MNVGWIDSGCIRVGSRGRGICGDANNLLIDQTCYLANKANTGVDHKMPEPAPGCAATCAKMGQPVALLTSDGKVYTVTGDLAANNNAKLVPHLSHKVELTGDVTEKGGTMTIAATNLKMISK